MDCQFVSEQIVRWLKNQLKSTGQKGFVIGVSGGVDSALVSTLSAMTGEPTIVASLPIGQKTELADKHIAWLTARYPNVRGSEIDLTQAHYQFELAVWADIFDKNSYSLDTNYNRDLVSANLRSRFRMCALYAFANASGFLVVGTGNKVEDFGIGFCTKGGDSMIDISPIGDLFKSEVKALASHVGVIGEIVTAAPTDGLWADGRTDEDQIGATYDELEWAMKWLYTQHDESFSSLTKRQSEVITIYLKRHTANQHKMQMPPICRRGDI
jgi:NAD+ synthase